MLDRTELARRVSADLTREGEPFEVVSSTVHGRTMKVWKNAPATLADLLVAGTAWGDLDFLVHGSERWTYRRHGQAAASLARWLAETSTVKPGHRVAIAASNRVDWSLAFWGAACAGAVVVPLNSWGTGEELEYAIRDSGATVLFADAPRLACLAGRLDGVTVIVLGALEPGVTPAAGTYMLAELIDADSPFSLPKVNVDTDDDATIFYTSGTTGHPKGAVGTHRNMTTNVMNLLFWGAQAKALAEAVETQNGATPAFPAPPVQEGALVTVPLFHATGCHATLVASMTMGTKLVLLNKFDPDTAVDLIEKERLTRLVGVPTTVMAVLDAGEGRDLSSVTYVAYGGSPAPPSLPARIRRQLPQASMGVGYGLTESSANATTNIGDDYEQYPDSVGTPNPVIEIHAVGPDGEALGPGEVGELVIYGPNIVRGYWHRPQDTAEAFVDGRLRTGDIGWIDADGRVYISDRSKDVVIRGGENVYCAEIEHVLTEHPDVAEAAIVGQPHPQLGEEVVAFVRPRDGVALDTLDVPALQRFVRGRLAAFKVPSVVRVTSEPLPRTATGKLRKDVLRERLPETVPTA